MAIAEITAALGAIKATTDVITAVLKADKALGEADLKLRLADAATILLDARTAVLDAQGAIEARDKEISQLKDALVNKTRVVKHQDAYYEIAESGAPIGEAYCMRCFERDHSLYHLSYPRRTDENTKCPVCRTEYTYYRTSRQQP